MLMQLIAFHEASFAWPCVLLDKTIPRFGGYHLERDGMSLHDAV